MEFAIWLAVLVPAMLNALDLGLFAYQKTQVANAAQAAAQAAWSTVLNANPSCTFSSGSGLSNCAALNYSSSNINSSTSVTTIAIRQSSVIGSSVTKTSETGGFYCPNATGTGLIAPDGSGANTCASAGNKAAGYYYYVRVSFTYRPIFPGVTVASLLGASITPAAWSRLQ